MLTLFVKVVEPGFHRWEDSPVDFLLNKHRHLFHITCEVEVSGEIDREVEFFVLQRDLRKAINSIGREGAFGLDFGEMSCETIAKKLCDLLCQFGYKVVSVTVSEDGEVGATYYCQR